MLDYQQFLNLLVKLQELAMLDSFMLHEVKEEECFDIIFGFNAPFHQMVCEGTFLWFWCEPGIGVPFVNSELNKLNILIPYEWEESNYYHHWVIQVK